jgi:hypothetical protein
MTPFPIAEDHSIRQFVTFQDQPSPGWREWVGALRIERDKATAYVNDPATHGMMMTDALINYSAEPSGDFDAADLVDGDVLFMHYKTVNDWMNAMRNSWFGGQAHSLHTNGEIPGAAWRWTTASGADVLIIQTDAVKEGRVLLWRTQNAAATHPTYETTDDDAYPDSVIISARMMHRRADVFCLRWETP